MVEKRKRKFPVVGEKVASPNLRRAYLILIYLKDGNHFISQIAYRMKLHRKVVTYWIGKMEEQGLCYCTNPESNKYRQYKVTPAGENFLALNDSTVPRDKPIEVQNGRFKCYIRKQENFLKFVQHKPYHFTNKPPGQELRNNIVYHGSVEGINITIIHGSVHIDKVTMIMTAPSFYAKTAKEGHYLMFKAMLEFQDFIDKQWDLDLSRMELDTEHVEYGFESPWARAYLTKSGGAPLKTNLFAVNASDPSKKAKEEYHNELDADRHYFLPDVVDRLRAEVSELHGSKEELVYKLDEASKTISILTESITTLTQSNKNTNESIANVAEKLTKLVDAISGKNNNTQGKKEENNFPLNDITKNMYS